SQQDLRPTRRPALMSEHRDQIHSATRKCLMRKRSTGRWPGPTVGPGAADGSLFIVRANVTWNPRRLRLSTSRRDAVTRNFTSPGDIGKLVHLLNGLPQCRPC